MREPNLIALDRYLDAQAAAQEGEELEAEMERLSGLSVRWEDCAHDAYTRGASAKGDQCIEQANRLFNMAEALAPDEDWDE
jgi:hypothetical protein